MDFVVLHQRPKTAVDAAAVERLEAQWMVVSEKLDAAAA